MKQVLVVGPPLAGVSGVIEALRAELPEFAVVGVDDVDPQRDVDAQRAPDAVVAVVSAVAPMTASDWELIASAAARTDLVVGAVSKIDAHRTWREVLAANRALGAGIVQWLGVAAAPQLGEPNVADLRAVLCDGLADPTLDRRNDLRRNAARPLPRRERPPPVVDSPVALQRVRLRLLRFVREGCASMRTELRDAAAAVPAGGARHFEARVRRDAARFVAEVDAEITRAVDGLAQEHVETAAALVPPRIEAAPSASRRLETRLMAVLGLGFGLGIALASNRLLSGLAPGLSIVGWVAGGVVGLGLVGWVVRTRGILHDRALLDRWVTDVAGALRWHGEAMVADRLLTIESARRTSRQKRQSGY